MKRILALILAVLMLVPLGGCGIEGLFGADTTVAKDDPDESVTLKIIYPMARQKDAALVEEAINKELETLLPNTKLEICDGTGFEEKWALWMSTRQEFDIVHTGFANDIIGEANNKSIIALDELVEEYAPNIKEEMKDYETTYIDSKVNGSLVAIPNIQVYPKNSETIGIPEDYIPYVDTVALVDEAWTSTKTTEKFWQILTEGLEAGAKAGLDTNKLIAPSNLLRTAQRGYCFIAENICYDESAEDVKIIDFYTTDEFKTFCKYTKLWYSKGWIGQDELVNEGWTGVGGNATLISYMDPETKANTWQLFQLDDPEYVATQFPLDNPELEIINTNTGHQSTYLSIPFTSKHPARAMKFIDLMHSEEGKVINDLLAYGIEGKHYEVIDEENDVIDAFDYNAQATNNNDYGIPNWMAAPTIYTSMIHPYDERQLEVALDYYASLKDAKKHPLLGFTFNLEEYSEKMGVIKKNNGEIAPSIYSGTISNTDSLYNELITKNKNAGLDEMIASLQKQADDYLKSQK